MLYRNLCILFVHTVMTSFTSEAALSAFDRSVLDLLRGKTSMPEGKPFGSKYTIFAMPGLGNNIHNTQLKPQAIVQPKLELNQLRTGLPAAGTWPTLNFGGGATALPNSPFTATNGNLAIQTSQFFGADNNPAIQASPFLRTNGNPAIQTSAIFGTGVNPAAQTDAVLGNQPIMSGYSTSGFPAITQEQFQMANQQQPFGDSQQQQQAPSATQPFHTHDLNLAAQAAMNIPTDMKQILQIINDRNAESQKSQQQPQEQVQQWRSQQQDQTQQQQPKFSLENFYNSGAEKQREQGADEGSKKEQSDSGSERQSGQNQMTPQLRYFLEMQQQHQQQQQQQHQQQQMRTEQQSENQPTATGGAPESDRRQPNENRQFEGFSFS